MKIEIKKNDFQDGDFGEMKVVKLRLIFFNKAIAKSGLPRKVISKKSHSMFLSSF